MLNFRKTTRILKDHTNAEATQYGSIKQNDKPYTVVLYKSSEGVYFDSYGFVHEIQPPSKAEQIRLIKSVWNKCEYVLNNRSWSLYGDQLLKMSRGESKDHTRFNDGSKRGLTITEESKLFAVQRLTSYLYDLEKAPSLESYYHSQQSVYLAYSLAKSFKDELEEVVTLETAELIKSFDYVELIKEEGF